MVILQVYSKGIRTKYKSRLLSKATLVYVSTGVLSIILPFIFAYNSRGFWLKRDVFFEQPNLKFKGQYLLEALTDDLTYPIVCSSLPYFVKTLGKFIKCSSIKVREIDNNFDLKSDELFISIKINLPDYNKLRLLSLIIPLDYTISNPLCPLQMQSAIILQHEVNLHISELDINAELDLHQSSPLICFSKKIHNFYNHSIITNENDIESYRHQSIIKSYLNRNLSTILTNKLIHVINTVPSNDFKLNLQVKFLEHRFYYEPGFWQIIKWAWIQYIAIYIFVAYLMKKIKNYLFQNKLVLYYEDNPLKNKIK